MDINATLFGQMITFAVFVAFTMKYIWPPLTKALKDREKKIADGLAAGAKGEQDLHLARKRASEILQQAKEEAAHIIDQGRVRVEAILQKAKVSAKQESERLIAQAQTEIERQLGETKKQLRAQVAGFAVDMAEKLVQRDMDSAKHQKLLDKMLEAL